MFETLDDIVKIYDINSREIHQFLYEQFYINVHKDLDLIAHRHNSEGFGDIPFHHSWKILVQEMPEEFNFLEIGVYKGQVISLIELLSMKMNKQPHIYGITPLSGIGDKFCSYADEDYKECIQQQYQRNRLSMGNTQIIEGFSQDSAVIDTAIASGPYDMVYIDGCHDYEFVVNDMLNYVPMLKAGGFLVVDDASKNLNGYGWPGYKDVARAIEDILDKNAKLIHLYAVGHNRVWKKV